jgi:hypothetical protein
MKPPDFSAAGLFAFDKDGVWDGDTWWYLIEWHGFRGYVDEAIFRTISKTTTGWPRRRERERRNAEKAKPEPKKQR